MTGASRDPGTSANFRYTTSTDMTPPRRDRPRAPTARRAEPAPTRALALAEHRRDARVGADAPAAARGLVHRRPQDRVAKRERPGGVGRRDQPGRQQLVERVDGAGRVDVRGARGDRFVERISRDGRALQQPSRRPRDR